MNDDNCRLCTHDGYRRISQTTHFTVLAAEGRDEPLFVVPAAHIRLMEIHELFAAEMWGLIRVASEKRVVFMSACDAGGHGYIALSLMREADYRWGNTQIHQEAA